MTSVDRIQGLSGSLAVKTPCRVATTADITLSGEQTIDAVAVVDGDRVLVKNQTDTTENGIYNVSTGHWTRALDFDGANDFVQGTAIVVQQGALYTSTMWKVTTAAPTIGAALAFDQLLPGDSTAVEFIQAGTGAVTRSAQDKLEEVVSVSDFGATGTGTETTAIQAALTAHDVVVIPGLETYTTGALTSTGKTIRWPAGTYTVNSNLADPLVLSNLSSAPALTFTLESRHAHARYFGDVTANDIYDAIYPDVSNFDVSCNVLHLAASSSVITNSAVAGYVKSDAAAATGGNGVALFGCAMASSNDAAVWGLNTLLQDDATRAVGTGTGRVLVGAEYDFNVMNTDTDVTGCSVGGNSLSAPAASNGYQVSPLGTGIPWGAGFVTQDAAATIGISIGMLAASGADVASQPLYFSWTDSGSTKRTAIIDVSNGFLRFESTGTLAGYAFQGASVFIDTGKSYSVNGLGVVSDRVTGFTAMTGTTDASTAYATGSITHIQLAERVAAIQAALTTHGMIGA